MAVGLVFFYLAMLLYGALLLPVACFAIFASCRLQRRTAWAAWGLLGWLLAAPTLTIMLIFAQDALGVAPDPMHDEKLQSLRIAVLGGCLGSLPLFLVPLGIRVFGAGEQKPLSA